MIYRVRHVTTYAYEAPVSFASCTLRVRPREDATQTLLESVVDITPRPSRTSWHVGQFGEPVLAALIDTPHKELRIEARSRVDVHRQAPGDPSASAAWEAVRDEAFDGDAFDPQAPAQFLYPTRMTPLTPQITDYARMDFGAGLPIVEAAFALARRIRADFAYDPDSTEVSTPVADAFAARHGVCQDFAHIMASGLRGLGLPAAYVSGYLRTFPPPGKPRLEGADATHAWINLWCGASLGWVGFDPTNALIVADNHIVVAIGRDYSDVAPIGGVILAPGDQNITVSVDVAPEDEGAAARSPSSGSAG